MNTQLCIVTGSTRGLGRALVEALIKPRVQLLPLARHTDPSLDQTANQVGTKLEQWSIDLAYPVAAATRLETWLSELDSSVYTSATLINNAALIGHIGPIEQMPADELAAVMSVNLEAPMALSAAFVRATSAWKATRKVLNISSGAGRSPIAGWAAYCASKAGLDHFTRVCALDQALQPNAVRFMALAPGVIDTDMQTQLRCADASGFPDQQRFFDLYAHGELTAPQDAARQILAILASPDFGQLSVGDIRTL